MLAMLGRLVMAAPATRYELDNLLLTLIYTPPWKLCENLYFYLKQNTDMEVPNEN
jgi:hypothetical protein